MERLAIKRVSHGISNASRPSGLSHKRMSGVITNDMYSSNYETEDEPR